MREEVDPGGALDGPSPIERGLHAIEPPPVPDDLLGRCLATVPGADRPPSGGRRRPALRRRIAAAIAAALLIGSAAILTRPHPADAAALLQSVRTAATRVAASHTVTVIRGPGGSRREEAWYVRDRGRRREVQVDGRPGAIVVRTRRWQFQWDVPGRLVAAWSTELDTDPPGPDGVVMDGEAMVRWAESHRAEIRSETESIAGRRLRRVILDWPGPPGAGSLPRRETIWFDPDSLRPVRQRTEYDDGKSIETQMDYPEPGGVPDDLFAFRPPPDVTIEINDPDLGRQVYSGPRTHDRPGANP